jgi:hypothetical protein
MSEHLCGETVPEQVGAAYGRMQIGAGERAAHDRRHRTRALKAPTRRPHAEKDATHRAGWSLAQIRRHGGADVRGQGEPIVPQPFLPADGDLSRAPVQILQLKRHHLPGAQPKASQQQQDRVVASPGRRPAIAGGEESLHLLGRKRSRNRGQPPVGNGGNGRTQIDAELTRLKEKPTQRAQRGHEHLGSARTAGAGMTLDERGHVGHAEGAERRPRLIPLLGQKLSGDPDVRLHRGRRQPTLDAQILVISALKLRARRLVYEGCRVQNDASYAEVCEQLAERRCGTTPSTRVTCPKKRLPDVLVETRERDATVNHPPIQRPHQRQLRTPRLPGVPLRDQMLSE